MNDLDDTDLLQWSEHQSALRPRRAAGESIDEAKLEAPTDTEPRIGWQETARARGQRWMRS